MSNFLGSDQKWWFYLIVLVVIIALFSQGEENIDISKKESKHLSCHRQKDYFYYHGIQHALCGKTNDFGFIYFTPKRILVIQMQ